MNRKETAKMNKSYEDQVEGRKPILELIEGDRDINKILIAKGEKTR